MRPLFLAIPLCLMVVCAITSCSDSFDAPEWDYRTRQLKDFAGVFPKANSVAVILAYGNVTTIASNETRNLDEKLTQQALSFAQHDLLSKGYQVRHIMSNAQDGNR